MRVCRIEHMSVLRDGRPAGPYADFVFEREEHESDDSWCDNYDNKNGCIHHFSYELTWIKGERRPMPKSDGIYDINSDHLFGFITEDKMLDWFSDWLRKLDRYGFVIGVYETPDTHASHGNKQSTFSYEASKRIAEFPILKRKGLAELLDA